MASYSKTAAAHETLTANVVDLVALTGTWSGVVIINRTGTSELYATYSVTSQPPADPTVAGDNTLVVPAATGEPIKITFASAVAGASVKIISSGAMAYSVEGF